MKQRKRILLSFISFVILCILQIIPVFAAKSADTGYAYLHFYTIDGDEITSLEKKVTIGKQYTFQDPDDYKYIVYKDGDTVIRGENDDLYDTVKGIEWWDETDENNIQKYTKGESWYPDTAGVYYFRVHTDNPAITGENIPLSTGDDLVYISFYDQNMDPIMRGDDYVYDTTMTTQDTYTFPDPKDTCDNGIYWACTTDEGKSYLFKAGEKVKFNAGSYEFHIATDDPVTVTFHYPFGSEISVENVSPGDQYGQTMSAKVGESVTLYKSPGAIIWGCTFKGWMNDDESDDKVYAGGTSLKIMDNQDISLSMVYEEDDDWDPNAKDLNGDMLSKPLMNTSENINNIGGTGYDTHIDGSGKLATKYTKKLINSSTVLYGVPSTYSKSDDLTSLVNGGDPKDVGSYAKDKYGYDMDDSKIENPNLGDVLKQDNSAQMMDVYGNSMMYHSDLSRLDDMCVAWIRLYEMKNSVPSFVAMISDWDQTEIDRFEAIEFALISQEYPGKANSLYKRFNSNDADVLAAKKKGSEFAPIESATLPEWKDEYMSERAFNMIKYTKTIFSGWADSYNDGVYEAYKGTDGSIHKVLSIQGNSFIRKFAGMVNKGARTLAIKLTNSINHLDDWNIAKTISGLFTIEAHAEPNSLGAAKQYGSYVTHSLDNETQIFRRQFFDKSKISRYGTYSFGALDGLSVAQVIIAQRLFNFLVEKGYSTAMAAGACGNVWHESDGFNTAMQELNPTSGRGGYGLLQWTGARRVALENYAKKQGKNVSDLDVQLDFLWVELNGNYNAKVNKKLSRYSNGASLSTVTNVKLAAEVWCSDVESPRHDTSKEAGEPAAYDGHRWSGMKARIDYAYKIYNALTMQSSGDFSGEGAILTPLTQFALSLTTNRSGIPYVWGGTTTSGFDCSGFAQYVFRKFGKSLPRTSRDQATVGQSIPVVPAYMRPGDLCFYANANGIIHHVAIYIGNGLIVGAQSSKSGIKTEKWDYARVACVRRVFNIDDAAITQIAGSKTGEDTDS